MNHVSPAEEILEVVEIEIFALEEKTVCHVPDTTSFVWTRRRSRWIVRK